MLGFVELTAADAFSGRLSRLFSDLLCPSFPDDDERESQENIQRFLTLKANGWYGPNNYHVVVLEEQGTIIATSISDYLALPNSAVIEFLAVAPAWRGRGLASSLLRFTEQLLEADARLAHARPLEAIFCEMDDPAIAQTSAGVSQAAPRSLIWHHWGFRRLDFRYLQPRLDPDKKPVEHLLLLCKQPGSDHVDCSLVRSALHEYLRLAMRIDDPSACPEFRQMEERLPAQSNLVLLPLHQ